MREDNDNHMIPRRILIIWKHRHLGIYSVALILALFAVSVAEDYPTRPIRLVVAFEAGGTTDFVARLMASKVSATVGQTMIVENKPGGNGETAAALVKRSQPDGYTLFFTTLGAMAINTNLRSKLDYNPRTDFTAIAMVARNTVLLAVNYAADTKTLAEFATVVKARNRLSVGVTGIGAVTYLCAALLQRALSMKFEIIAYRGASQALSDLLGGHIDAMFGEIPVLIGSIKGGSARALASTSRTRVEVIPDVPTFIELGFSDIVAENWAGIVAPATTSPVIVDRLTVAIETAMADSNTVSQLARSGVTPSFANGKQFRSVIDSEIERWGRIIRENALQIQ